MNTTRLRLRLLDALLQDPELTDEHLCLIIHRLTGPMGERFFAPSDQTEFVILLQSEKSQEPRQEVLDTSDTTESARGITGLPRERKGIRRKEDYRIPIGDHPVDHQERLCKHSRCQKRLVREIDETPSHFKRRVVCNELCRRLLASEQMTGRQQEKRKKEIAEQAKESSILNEEPAAKPAEVQTQETFERHGGHCEIHGDYLHGPNGCPSCYVASRVKEHQVSGDAAGYRVTGHEA